MASALRSYKRRKDVFSETSVLASKPMSLNDLPNEILLKIISHFGPEDLCLVIAEVCERWSVLAKDVLWKTHTYHCGRSSDISRITEVLRAAPSLHSLIICERMDVADILKVLNHIHRDLRKLMIKYCGLGRTGILTNIVALYPDLEVLSLEGCLPCTSADYNLIPCLKKLSELNLSGCQGLSEETVRFIADSCQQLKKLSLRGVRGSRQIVDDDVIHVINKLGKQLTTLDLSGEHLTDVAYSYLNNCARLQELYVSCGRKMTDRGLLEGIGSLHGLTSLRLAGCYNLTAQALSTFLHRPSMSSIVMLSLTDCYNLDDEGLKGIAKRCIHLKELTVYECDVTDAGISMVISQCNQLRVLILKGLPYVTGEGYLALVPSHLPHLRRLCLWGCNNVRDKYVEELVAAAPELKVFK